MAEHDDPFELVGKVLDGRYRIEAVAGEGGFGVVYRAFHLLFETKVAIKVLKLLPHATAKQRQAFVEAFHREGKLLRNLSQLHGSFVRVEDMGTITAVLAPFLVLEWLEGESLATELERRRSAGAQRRSLAETMALLAPIADALATAHSQNPRVAHRDVKPANIFLAQTRKGKIPKLLDLGLAKIMTETGSDALLAPTQGAQAGRSPRYAAPEQWSEKYGRTGPWTDVYAFALVCVEMLTDSFALKGNDAMQLMAATVDPERPTPRARGAEVLDAVEDVFRKALAVHVNDRFREMAAFWKALLEATQTASKAAAAPRALPVSPASGDSTLGGPTLKGPPNPPALNPTEDVTEPMPSPPGKPSALSATTQPMSRWNQGRTWIVATATVALGLGVGAWARWPRNGADTPTGSAPVASAINMVGAVSSGLPVVPVSNTSSGSTLSPASPCGEKMVLIPGGTFEMGSRKGDPDQQPTHPVSLRPYCLDITEVTVAAYSACVLDGKCTIPSKTVDWKGISGEAERSLWSSFCNTGHADRQNHPINCVDWYEADAFCSKQGKRLPTEREWEYAARGGNEDRPYPWGKPLPGPTLLNACGSECVKMMQSKGQSVTAMYMGGDPWPSTADVGSFSEGRALWGNLDMVGNVWEWTASWYCPYPSDGRSKCVEDRRVLRGGGWADDNLSVVRTTFRERDDPEGRYKSVGFRCAKDVVP